MAVSFHSLYALIRDVLEKLLEEVYVSKGLTQIDFLSALGVTDEAGKNDVSNFASKCVNKQSLYDEVHNALYGISDAYSDGQLKVEANGNLFNDPVYRCAYIYLYFVSHSYLVRLFLMEAYKSSDECRLILDTVLESGVLKTCAVGGGPGTDVVGMVLFLRELAVLKKQYSRSPVSPPAPLPWQRENYGRRPLHHPSFRNRMRSLSCPTFGPNQMTNYHPDIGCGRRVLHDRNRRSPVDDRQSYPVDDRQSYPVDDRQSYPVDHRQSPPYIQNRSWCTNQYESESNKSEITKPVRLRAIILDNCESWRETSDSTFHMLRPLCSHFGCHVEKVRYGVVDLTSQKFMSSECTALEYADVVTMVKVVSAIAGNTKENEIALEAMWSLFKKLKPGCLVLYIDNSGGGSTELVCGAAESLGMKELFRAISAECRVPRSEDKKFLDFYRLKFRYEPQSKAKVSAIVWKK